MTKQEVVILSEHSESKDLGTDLTANIDEMRRFLDFARNDIVFHCTFGCFC